MVVVVVVVMVVAGMARMSTKAAMAAMVDVAAMAAMVDVHVAAMVAVAAEKIIVPERAAWPARGRLPSSTTMGLGQG